MRLRKPFDLTRYNTTWLIRSCVAPLESFRSLLLTTRETAGQRSLPSRVERAGGCSRCAVMPRYVLMYFDGRGRGEIARYLFALAGIPYEDRRISKDEWMRLKSSIPTGTLPALQVEGTSGYLTQSMSIARYLAHEFDLAGNTPWEHAIIDMFCDTAGDLTNPVSLILFQEKDPTKKRLLLEKFISDDVPKIYRLVDAHMKSDFILGKKASLADAAVYYIMEFSKLVDPECINRSSKVKLLCTNFEQLPNILDWLHSRPWTSW